MTASFLRAFAPTEIDSMSNRRIVTEHVYPPIPARYYDWRATFDDYEPGDLMGYGPTKEAAIANLILQAGDGSYELAETKHAR